VPNSLAKAEFSAFQNLRLGRSIPWVTLVRELASSNLKFGIAETIVLVSQLALVCGPPDGDEVLRVTHRVFKDRNFCKALATQIQLRLDQVAANWREGQTVQCMVILIQRLWALASCSAAVKEAEELLLRVRQITYHWTNLLRNEIHNAPNIEVSQRRSEDALLVALLCRQTYVIELSKPDETMNTKVCGIPFFLRGSLY